ncbi:hypothetical protein [Candidatus Fokinia crypta]|uniref:DNA polymerase III subunit delta domain protein n=1 Tax=Candidatus Fokinia crypta TaxID=1920990 RepID=A0ABZ0UT88_9RICK|nr:hypothetical protein [Candidatus Fokinia cryptica]WPX98145.1 DNA polymerase III subunit delta domain protein [Candidatus Fokinia cryptica]
MKYLHHNLEREINAITPKNLWFIFGEEYGGVCFALSALKNKLRTLAAMNAGNLSIHEMSFKQLNTNPELLDEITRASNLFSGKREVKLIIVNAVSNDISTKLSQRLNQHILALSKNTFIAVVGSGLKKNLKTRRFFESSSTIGHIAFFHSYSLSEQEKQSFWLYLLSKNKLQIVIATTCPDSLLSVHIALCSSRMEMVNAIEKMCINSQHECDVLDLSDKKYSSVRKIHISEEEIKAFFPFENDIKLLDIVHHLLFYSHDSYVNYDINLDISALRWLQSYCIKLSILHQICLKASSDTEVINAMLEIRIFLPNKQKSDLIGALRCISPHKISELITLFLCQEKAIRTMMENDLINDVEENDKVVLQKLLRL